MFLRCKINPREIAGFYINLSLGIFDCLIMASRVPMGMGLFLPCAGTGTIMFESLCR